MSLIFCIVLLEIKIVKVRQKKRTFILHIRLGIKNDCSNHYNFTFTKKATDTNDNLKLGLNQNELLNSNAYQ